MTDAKPGTTKDPFNAVDVALALKDGGITDNKDIKTALTAIEKNSGSVMSIDDLVKSTIKFKQNNGRISDPDTKAGDITLDAFLKRDIEAEKFTSAKTRVKPLVSGKQEGVLKDAGIDMDKFKESLKASVGASKGEGNLGTLAPPSVAKEGAGIVKSGGRGQGD